MLFLEVAAESAAAASAPWWGVPVIAGSFLLLGAILGFFFNWLLEGRKQKRAQAIRWDEHVLAHTSSVMTLVKRLRAAASNFRTVEKTLIELSVDALKRGEAVTPPPVRKPHLDELFESYDSLQRECDLLELVSPPPIREAVSDLMECAAAVVRQDLDEEGFTVSIALRKSADDLASTVRGHFGIK